MFHGSVPLEILWHSGADAGGGGDPGGTPILHKEGKKRRHI